MYSCIITIIFSLFRVIFSLQRKIFGLRESKCSVNTLIYDRYRKNWFTWKITYLYRDTKSAPCFLIIIKALCYRFCNTVFLRHLLIFNLTSFITNPPPPLSFTLDSRKYIKEDSQTNQESSLNNTSLIYLFVITNLFH